MIPFQVLTRIEFHAGQINAFNLSVETIRRDYVRFGDAGRYEWEYRLAHESAALASIAQLAEIEAIATARGISLDALYTHVGGKPEVLPWSPEALAWRQPAA